MEEETDTQRHCQWQWAPGFGWDTTMALTYVTSSVVDVFTVLPHSLVPLWFILESWLCGFPHEFHSFSLLFIEILLNWQGPAQVCLFTYLGNNSSVSSWSLRTPWLLGSDTCKSSIYAVSLWYLCCLIMSHFRTGVCLEGWLPDDFWLGASIIFSLCMSVHVLPLLLLLGV